MSVFDMIRDSMPHTVPFAKQTGISLTDVSADSATAAMSQTHTNSNHMGSVHSGALFTLAETAAGAAIAGAFAPYLMKGLRAFPTELNIRYAKPAKGNVTAQASIAQPLDAHSEAMDRNGRTDVVVSVAIISEDTGALIGGADTDWSLRID